jgi:hypothetical protein
MTKPTLTVKDLRDYLAVCEIAACEDVDPPITRAEFAALRICVRLDDGHELHVGGLASVEVEEDHAGETMMLVLDAEQTTDPPDAQIDSPPAAVNLTERGALATATMLLGQMLERFTYCESDADERMRNDVIEIMPKLRHMIGARA